MPVAFKDSPLLKQARDRFKLANEADDAQAQRERDDIAFEAGEQWPADIKLARMGQQPTAGQPAVPARPTLVINKVKEPVRQILNQERASDIGVELVPADDFGDLGITPDDTEVTLREGLIRRIQRDSQATDARTWAFKRAVIAGRGYYLVMTRFLPGKTWDQEIYIHRIYNQAGVLLDPSHEQPDGSDADWEFIGTWVPWERAVKEYPKLADGSNNPFADTSEDDFIAMTEDYPDWYRQYAETTDTKGNPSKVKQQAVRVVDYWYTERMARTLVVLGDGSAMWENELTDENAEIVDSRTVVEVSIKYCKILGGVLIVDETDWAGPDMPIVKVLGDELLPFDEQRRAEGMIRNARDSQMAFNYMVSKQVEQIGLTPIAPLMVDPDAIDGFETEYQQANTRTIGTLKYRTYNDEGKELRPPMRPPVDPNILPLSQSIALFDQTIKSTTAIPDPTLGNVDPTLKSGRAIKEVVQNAQLSTSNFMDNLARSVRYEGHVINNLLFPIYGTKPNRLVRILTGEGENQTMLIGDPQQADPQMQQRAAQVAKLTEDAHFNVLVKVKKAPDSRRDQFIEMFGQILAADPAQMLVAGDLYYKNLDIPEAKALAKRQRVMLAPPIQKLLADEESGEAQIPPPVQAQMAQQQEQLQHAEAAISELQKALQEKQVERETQLEIERMRAELDRVKLEFDLKKAEMDNATKIRVAEIAAETKGIVSAQALEHEAIALDHTQQHEAQMAADQREHEARVGAQTMAHQAAMSDGQRDFEAGEAEAGREATAYENEANRQATSQGDGDMGV